MGRRKEAARRLLSMAWRAAWASLSSTTWKPLRHRFDQEGNPPRVSIAKRVTSPTAAVLSLTASATAPLSLVKRKMPLPLSQRGYSAPPGGQAGYPTSAPANALRVHVAKRATAPRHAESACSLRVLLHPSHSCGGIRLSHL